MDDGEPGCRVLVLGNNEASHATIDAINPRYL